MATESSVAEAEDAAIAWAATSSWRGDVKLFAQIAERAIAELKARGVEETECLIEFAVRDDLERYGSAQDLFESVPASTLRMFSSARIHVTGGGFRIEVRFGRKRSAKNAAFDDPPGISVQVTSGRPGHDDELEAIRSAIVCTLKRGGFFWAAQPIEGPTGTNTNLTAALKRRWKRRQAWARLLFASLILLVFTLAFVAFRVLDTSDGSSDPPSGEEIILFLIGVVGVAWFASPRLAAFVFPAIEIADVTPGRRIFRVVARSGIVTTAVGALGTLLVGKPAA